MEPNQDIPTGQPAARTGFTLGPHSFKSCLSSRTFDARQTSLDFNFTALNPDVPIFVPPAPVK